MAADIPGFDLYAELEVSERASVETIQAAYRSLQLRHHPDRVGDGAGDRAVRLNIAREWLTDPDRRARYDAHLARLRSAAIEPPAADVEEAWPDGLDDFDDSDDDAGADAEPDAEGDADDAGDDDAGDDPDPAPGLLQTLRRHVRIDALRLGRIWMVGLAALGVVALEPEVVGPAPVRAAVAGVVTVTLAGTAVGWRRARAEGLGSRLARWAGMLVGTALIAVLAIEGVRALVQIARHEPAPPGIADVAVPFVAITALLSLFAIRRRHGPVDITVDEFLAMTPREFETAVGEILANHGFRLTLTGGPGDLAADLMGTDRDGRPTVVQCKRYAPGHPVGSRDVQMLIAMGMRHHNAEHLVLVTTSDFTDPARDLAEQHEVELIDGEDLEDLTR